MILFQNVLNFKVIIECLQQTWRHWSDRTISHCNTDSLHIVDPSMAGRFIFQICDIKNDVTQIWEDDREKKILKDLSAFIRNSHLMLGVLEYVDEAVRWTYVLGFLSWGVYTSWYNIQLAIQYINTEGTTIDDTRCFDAPCCLQNCVRRKKFRIYSSPSYEKWAEYSSKSNNISSQPAVLKLLECSFSSPANNGSDDCFP